MLKIVRNGIPKDIFLSVLIPTLKEREHLFKNLLAHLIKLIKDSGLENNVEIVYIVDNREMSVGKKRNILIDNAIGRYLVFIDDDDTVSNSYFTDIFIAMKSDPDVITFKGIIKAPNKKSLDGRIFIHKLDFKNQKSTNNIYYKSPNHLNPIKYEIIKKVIFKDIDVSEDYFYAKKIINYLYTEVFINKILYIYQFEPSRSVQYMKKKKSR